MPENAGKGKEALKRARARLSLISAFNAAAAGLQSLDPKQYGYEADALARQDSLRQHLRQPQVSQPTDSERETLTRPPMTKEEKRFSRGLLGSVARFHRTSRGVCVRSGDPQHQEWAKVKSAEVKLSYAIYLLERDLEHYRHLYREGVYAAQVSGRLKYYQAPVSPLRVPELWLSFPELAAAQDLQQPPKEWHLAKILEPFPELWKSFHAARWAAIEEQTAKRKVVKPKAPAVPPATAAAAGKPAAPPPPAAAEKAAPPKAAATPGKAAPPPAPAAKTSLPPAPAAGGKGGPSPAPPAGGGAKGGPSPAPPAAGGKGGPPPERKRFFFVPPAFSHVALSLFLMPSQVSPLSGASEEETAGAAAVPSGFSVFLLSLFPKRRGNKERAEEPIKNLTGCSALSLQEQHLPSLSFQEKLNPLFKWQASLFSCFALQNWRVRTVAHALSAMLQPPNLLIVHCNNNTSSSSSSSSGGERRVEEVGGYSPAYNTVWLCGNRLWSPWGFRRVLLHELLHAFDFARAVVDSGNCMHVACTEIRAVNLSEQCGLWASRGLTAAELENPIDKHSLLTHAAAISSKRSKEAAAFKTLADEAAAAAADATAAAAAVAATAAESAASGPSKNQEAHAAAAAAAATAAAAVKRAESLAARAAAAAKEAAEAHQAAAAATTTTPPEWLASKRNRCVALQARVSVQQLQQCREAGKAETAVAAVFSRCLRDTFPFEHPPEFDSKWRPSRIFEENTEHLKVV
ncbi:hypothetical protein Esti_006501 [Eimeria stiedai]